MATNMLLGYPDIPFSATTTYSNAYDNLGNTVFGSKSKISSLSTSATGRNDLYYALGSGSTANYLSILRAKNLQSNSVTGVTLRNSSVAFDYPSTFGSLKLWLDAGQNVTMDSSNRVSNWAPRSGTGTFTQSTTSKQPIYTRADNKENWLKYSEQFTNSAWNKSVWPVTATDNFTTDPNGGSTAAKINCTTGSGRRGLTNASDIYQYATASYIFSVYLKYVNQQYLWVGEASDTGWDGCNVDILNGTIQTGVNNSARSITSVGNGWYRVSITYTRVLSGGSGVGVWFSTSGNLTAPPAVGLSTSDAFYIWGAQLTRASADTTYLSTTSLPQYMGINGHHAIQFDGIDDYMTSTTALSSIMTNSAKTIYMVIKPFNMLTDERTFQDTGNKFNLQFGVSNNKMFIRNDDGAADYIEAPTMTKDTVYVVQARHTGGNIYISVNGGTENSIASGNTSDLTGTLILGVNHAFSGAYWAGQLAEMLVFNAALSTQELTNMRQFLTDKYVTTPVYSNYSFNTQTLTGTNSEDFITTFSTSSSAQYWCLSFDSGSTSSTRPFSKVFFGTLFDLGRDPVQGRNMQNLVNQDRNRYLPLHFSCTWEGISDATRENFETYIGQYAADFYFILHPSSYTYITNGVDPVYVRIESYEFSARAYNTNELTIAFAEVI